MLRTQEEIQRAIDRATDQVNETGDPFYIGIMVALEWAIDASIPDTELEDL